MPNALIYSPDLDGHRQVYVFVLNHILKELGFTTFIAGNWQQEIADSTYIDKLKSDKEITIINTSDYAENGIKITIEELLEIQNKFNINLTVFPEADFHINLFNTQVSNKKNRLKGRTVGIFLRPFYFYKKLSFINRLRFIKHLPSTWKYDERLFHDYLLRRFKLLDHALYLDEYFVSRHPATYWLPDVFQQYAETLVGNEKSIEQTWTGKLNEFKGKNEGRFVFLYFGTAQKRRGYDLLLKMAVDNNGCFIHCGLNDRAEKYEYDVVGLKNYLDAQGRLLETNQYISDPQCIEQFFRSATHLILPYRNFPGSSGVMLQALSYGIPVLVPEKGVMGYRVKKYKLGLTYNDENSLFGQFEKFKELAVDIFKGPISEYMKYQTTRQLKKTLVNVFNGSRATIKHP